MESSLGVDGAGLCVGAGAGVDADEAVDDEAVDDEAVADGLLGLTWGPAFVAAWSVPPQPATRRATTRTAATGDLLGVVVMR
jgi:hypothetical protein